MLKEVKIKGINSTDRVFKYEDFLVKVRLLKNEINQKNKLLGPSALSLHLSASICDEKGKAIPREDGKYCILPHTITIPVTDLNVNDHTMKKGLEDILKPLIKQAVNWHKTLASMEILLAEWKNSSLSAAPKKKFKKN